MNHMGYNMQKYLLTGIRIQAAKHLASEMGLASIQIYFLTPSSLMFIVDTHIQFLGQFPISHHIN